MSIVEWRHPVRLPWSHRSLYVLAIGVIVGVGLAVIAFHVAELLHHRSTSRRRSQH
ncbi:hypothetical protein [Brachybacterium sp.]|uniref:hypothetical protein n=1 Tax=Brachybacterium sp. TaxID=1891286 RepID=UPI002ED02A1C